LFSLNLKHDLAVGVLLVIYIHFLHVWLKHIVDMLRFIEESQENTETMRRLAAHGRFSLLHKANINETQAPKQRTNHHCIWSPSYRSVK